jgi:AraC family transcriptional regulator
VKLELDVGPSRYYEKFQSTIDFIELHLKEDLSPSLLAGLTFFSVTHFYRIFRGIVGYSVKEYIRKRRLSQSAIDLLASEKRIIEIAMEYGFESEETYIRAFVKQFGTTPGRYRKQIDHIVLCEKANIVHLLQGRSSYSVETKIIYRKAFHVVGMQALVKPGSGTIKELWAAFHKRKPEIEYQTFPEASIGVCEYYPDITDESDFSYIASTEVSHHTKVPPGMVNRVIPSTKYAVFSHNESIDRLKDIYQYIYGVWLPESGYELAELDTIEYYELKSSHSQSGLAIYIPVR